MEAVTFKYLGSDIHVNKVNSRGGPTIQLRAPNLGLAFTPVQLDTTLRILEGKSNKQIAKADGIGPSAVRERLASLTRTCAQLRGKPDLRFLQVLTDFYDNGLFLPGFIDRVHALEAELTGNPVACI